MAGDRRRQRSAAQRQLPPAGHKSDRRGSCSIAHRPRQQQAAGSGQQPAALYAKYAQGILLMPVAGTEPELPALLSFLVSLTAGEGIERGRGEEGGEGGRAGGREGGRAWQGSSLSAASPRAMPTGTQRQARGRAGFQVQVQVNHVAGSPRSGGARREEEA